MTRLEWRGSCPLLAQRTSRSCRTISAFGGKADIASVGDTRPRRRGLPAPRNTDEIDAWIRRAPSLAIVHEDDRKTRSFDYWAKGFRGRAGIVLQKNDHAAWFYETTHSPQK